LIRKLFKGEFRVSVVNPDDEIDFSKTLPKGDDMFVGVHLVFLNFFCAGVEVGEGDAEASIWTRLGFMAQPIGWKVRHYRW